EAMSVNELVFGVRNEDLPVKMNQEQLKSFMRWLFQDYLVKIIKRYFYVTDSAAHKNRLFYFRHDVWSEITKSFLSDIQKRMFEECKGKTLIKPSWNELGTSQLRLIPKGDTFRPVMNLRKK